MNHSKMSARFDDHYFHVITHPSYDIGASDVYSVYYKKYRKYASAKDYYQSVSGWIFSSRSLRSMNARTGDIFTYECTYGSKSDDTNANDEG